MTDAELVSLWKEDDPRGFDELYERYKNEAFRVAVLITGNCSDAEDLTQEAFIACAGSIRSLKDNSKFRAWLLRSVTRASWKYCKKRNREQPTSEFFEAGTVLSPQHALFKNEVQRTLYHALYTLDDKKRNVIILYYFEELSVKEIAIVLGVMEGTVKSRLFSARNALRKELTALQPDIKEMFL